MRNSGFLYRYDSIKTILNGSFFWLMHAIYVCTDTMNLIVFVQDQVDTLTFQNQSLRDKAKRFEEALRRSTDEQIVVSLPTATYSSK